MKKTVEFVLIIVSFVCLLLLTTKCTRFEFIDFLTDSIYTLDSNAHEIEVIAKQKAYINAIMINGEMGSVHLGYVFERDTIINYEKYSVKYEKGEPVEILGEWFNIKKNPSDSKSTHIFIDENKEEIERTLMIDLYGHPYIGEIKITQKKRD